MQRLLKCKFRNYCLSEYDIEVATVLSMGTSIRCYSPNTNDFTSKLGCTKLIADFLSFLRERKRGATMGSKVSKRKTPESSPKESSTTKQDASDNGGVLLCC